ncbi:hypothetical protein K461DRAFT_297963 [Myriangium duriaei CBS 260.36]|uniref:2EXR domain-containing protein n=1 Tax=Myriangium duriaei CBS 260.36 TaxID=1168546 RepID=A0A9P4MCU3_9PEZI|nr:hypothetical protein K461DRAFT_297963 [Myriangium duriaei CBS 260.36]
MVYRSDSALPSITASRMAEFTSSASTFHPFPRLPPELRLQIWQLCLPELGPCFCPWRPPRNDFWEESSRLCGNPQARPKQKDRDIGIAQLRITYPLPPLARTNKEANAAAQTLLGVTWPAQLADEDRGKIRLLTRSSDCSRDFVYFSTDNIFNFWSTQMLESGSSMHTFRTIKLVIHQELVEHYPLLMKNLLELFEVVYVVCGILPESRKCHGVNSNLGGVWKWDSAVSKFRYTLDASGWKNRGLEVTVQAIPRYVPGRRPTGEIREVVVVLQGLEK